jgi:hypothetical protein
MTGRVFQLALMASAVFAVGILLLGLTMRIAAPREMGLSLSPNLHIGVSNARRSGGLGRVEIFNDARGPYRGSILGLVGADGKTYPPLDCEIAWGDARGVYYRYFRGQDGRKLWTLSVSLWYPLLASAAFPLGRLVRCRNRASKV